MLRVLLFVIAAVSVSLVACDKPSTTTTAHAPASFVPGSHEDWCGEHAVPESQCTRCHPELIAAFKATNDWCAEHGLPESQCLKCHPDLKIVRPTKGAATAPATPPAVR